MTAPLPLAIDPDFTPTPITVSTRGADSDVGATYAQPVQRIVVIDDGRRQVRSSNGELTVAESTIYDTPDQAPLYTVGSRVTINGRDSLVITARRRILGDPDVDHLEVTLT